MKRTYETPVLVKRDALAEITAGDNKVSPFFKDEPYT